MTRQSPFSVRGRHALVIMKDEREIPILRRQLHRLGMSVTEADPEQIIDRKIAVDVIILDADSFSIDELACM